jgi:hypothetical protein
MANVLKTAITEALNGKSFNIKDSSTGWDDDYSASNVETAKLTIVSQNYPDVKYDLKTSTDETKWLEFLDTDGHDVLADDLGFGTYIKDGYYEITLDITLDTAPDVDSYQNIKGFVAEHKNRALALAAAIKWPVYSPEEEMDKLIANVLLDAAEASAANAFYENFNYIINKINLIYDKYELDSLW